MSGARAGVHATTRGETRVAWRLPDWRSRARAIVALLPIALFACDRVADVSPDALAREPWRWKDRRVHVVTTLRAAGARECTAMACPKDARCCNSCTTQIGIGQNVVLTPARGDATFTCSGDNCNPAARCPTLDASGAATYELEGTIREQPGSTYVLAVTKYARVDHAP